MLADNVVPRIGVLAPDSARAAIREMFLAHVIGGKHLSDAATDFTAMVRGATPDVVLTGVELLARGLDDAHPGAGDVVVVDVGGATTDVHSRGRARPRHRSPRRPGPRGRRHHPGHPHRRGRPRHALVGGHHRRAEAGLRRPGARPRRVRQRRPRLPARDRRRARRGRGDRRGPRSGSPCAATPAGRRVVRQPRGPGRRAHRQGPARGRPAGRLGRGAPPRAAGRRRRGCSAGSVGADVDGRLAAAARGRGSSSTPTTCWPRPACWPRAHPDGGVPAGAARLVTAGCDSLYAVSNEAERSGESPTAGRDGRPPARPGAQLPHPRAAAPRAAEDEGSPSGSPSSGRMLRDERRPPSPSRSRPGPSNFTRAQVPWGLDLAAAWAWRFLVIVAAGYVIARLIAFFAVVVLPVVVALLIAALVSPVVDWLHRLGLPRGLGRDPRRARRPRRSSPRCSPSPGSRSPTAPTTWPTRPSRGSTRSGTGCGPARCTPATARSTTTSTGPRRRSRRAGDGGSILSRVTEVGTALGHVLAGFFIVLFSTYFFLADGDRIWAWVVRLSPRAGPRAGRQLRPGRLDLADPVRAGHGDRGARPTRIGIMIVAADPRGAVRARDRRAGLPRRVRADGRRHRRRHRRGAGRPGRPGPGHRAAHAGRRDPGPADRGPRAPAVPDGPLGLGAPARGDRRDRLRRARGRHRRARWSPYRWPPPSTPSSSTSRNYTAPGRRSGRRSSHEDYVETRLGSRRTRRTRRRTPGRA